MIVFLNAFSFALLWTSLFAFRFQFGRRPKLLAIYFAAFFVFEYVAGRCLPEGALGIEVTYLCLGLTSVFVIATYLAERFGNKQRVSDPDESPHPPA